MKAGARSDVKDVYGETPLMMAAYNDNAAVAAMLVQHGADVDAKDHQGGTALIMAASFGNLRVARILLNAGANKETKDKKDDSALEYAMAANHDAMVALLDMQPDKRLAGAAAIKRRKKGDKTTKRHGAVRV